MMLKEASRGEGDPLCEAPSSGLGTSRVRGQGPSMASPGCPPHDAQAVGAQRRKLRHGAGTKPRSSGLGDRTQSSWVDRQGGEGLGRQLWCPLSPAEGSRHCVWTAPWVMSCCDVMQGSDVMPEADRLAWAEPATGLGHPPPGQLGTKGASGSPQGMPWGCPAHLELGRDPGNPGPAPSPCRAQGWGAPRSAVSALSARLAPCDCVMGGQNFEESPHWLLAPLSCHSLCCDVMSQGLRVGAGAGGLGRAEVGLLVRLERGAGSRDTWVQCSAGEGG